MFPSSEFEAGFALAAECAACLAELKANSYRGLVSIDFEHDTPALQGDMRKNITFIDTIARSLLA